ncbi:hypothetical protein PFLUV_G00156770 [Perca fluviatilis]|uniref:ZP domain-containing protein n=1 Tax=Perca fluviatilis TaxID=8168 RepID=A0A6A5F118_PERFL|nr:hypothetical protein PFLUV_G00156770 [Perca fluviatilis]
MLRLCTGLSSCRRALRGSMAGVRVEMLLVLTVMLLLVPVKGWEHINGTQLVNSDESGQLNDPQNVTDDSSYFASEEEFPEDVLFKVGGASTSETVNPFADHGFQIDTVDAPLRNWTSHSSCVLEVVCSDVGFQITLLTVSLSEITILDLDSKELSVMDAPKSCGYEVDPFQNTLSVPFTGCNVKHTDGYSLQLLYVDKTGISASDCEERGCCVSSSDCYYPLDECTAGNFVFAIRFNSTSIPLDPTKLIIPGSPNCKPAIVNDKVAIFKFKVTECGARAFEVGETTIYLTEVQSVVQTWNLKYGIISRSDYFKFMIECRYSKSQASPLEQLAHVSYMVKTPCSSLPLSIISDGLYGVTLRIAQDETYSSYFPTYHQPLRMLLGKPVMLWCSFLKGVPILMIQLCLYLKSVAFPKIVTKGALWSRLFSLWIKRQTSTLTKKSILCALQKFVGQTKRLVKNGVLMERNIPVLERIPQKKRPTYHMGGNHLMASQPVGDWVNISEMLLGPEYISVCVYLK